MVASSTRLPLGVRPTRRTATSRRRSGNFLSRSPSVYGVVACGHIEHGIIRTRKRRGYKPLSTHTALGYIFNGPIAFGDFVCGVFGSRKTEHGSVERGFIALGAIEYGLIDHGLSKCMIAQGRNRFTYMIRPG